MFHLKIVNISQNNQQKDTEWMWYIINVKVWTPYHCRIYQGYVRLIPRKYSAYKPYKINYIRAFSMPNLGDDKNARKYLKPCRHPECLKLTENRFCVNHFKPCKKVK